MFQEPRLTGWSLMPGQLWSTANAIRLNGNEDRRSTGFRRNESSQADTSRVPRWQGTKPWDTPANPALPWQCPNHTTSQLPAIISGGSTSLKATPMTDVTRILSAIEQGDPSAAEQFLPLVYDELRKLAAQKTA